MNAKNYYSVFIIVFLICSSCNSYLFYQAPRYDEQTIDQIESDPRVNEIVYDMPFGKQTSFYIAPRIQKGHAPEHLWILFGGINTAAFGWYQWFKNIPDSCCALFFIEYPGYGKCEGVPRAERILESSLTAFTALALHLDVPLEMLEENLGLLGHSLGSLTMMQFAPYVNEREILLISPMSSLSDQVEFLYGSFKGRLLNIINPENYDNKVRLAEILQQKNPPKITIIHGDQDEVIPVSMGRSLAAFSDSITYIEIHGAGHSGLIAQQIELIQTIMFDD
jgi:pimeloyl-ACP methyl ester carboxylesterase